MSARIAPQLADERNRARVLWRSGFHPQARAAYELLIAKSDDPETHFEYGQYLLQTGETPAAIQQFQWVLEFAHNSQSFRLAAEALNALACAYRQQGNSTQAVTAQRRSFALKLADEQVSESEFTTDIANLATDAISAGDLQLAEQLLQRSLSLEIAAGSLEGQASDLGNLAIVRGMQGEIAAGINLLRQTLRLHRQLQDDRSVGCDLLNLAAFYESQGRQSRSQGLLEIALRILRGIAAADLCIQAEAALERAAGRPARLKNHAERN